LGNRHPTTAELEDLRHDGFSVVVSLLLEEAEAPRYDVRRIETLGFVRHNIGVRDFHPPSVEQVT